MANTTVSSGTTRTSRLNMGGTDQLIVEANGTISVSSNAQSVRFNAATNGAWIDNSGLIENTADGGRAIRFETTVGSALFAHIGNSGTIQSSDDAIQIQAGSVTSGEVSITNSGTIHSVLGQAVDFAGGTGTFITTVDNTGSIISEQDDAIRVGAVGHITNHGTLTGGAGSDLYAKADGIQFEDGTTGWVENLAGVIQGDRHGINAGNDSNITVTNAAGAEIIGHNGSGVGSDGSATVINYGTITGSYTPGVDVNSPAGGDITDGIFDGDGDGVDIDFKATIENHGVIQGTGAGGNGSDGLPNTSEGIAAGGGSITNYAGASITGLGLGILIDDSSQGNAFYQTTIVNDGLIAGQNSVGIKIVSDLDDTIANSGTITGGNGMAIVFGSGDNTLFMIGDHAVVNGTTEGGDGTDTLDYSGYTGGSVTVNLASGVATATGGVLDFENVVGSAAADRLTGNDQANIFDGGLGADTMVGGKGDDSYFVDNRYDKVVESAGEGVDTVHTTANNYGLAANVENLVVEGKADLKVLGNDLDNTITGNDGDNNIQAGAGNDVIYAGKGDDWLDGGLGADTFHGSAGDDTYIIDNKGDTVVDEAIGGGTDQIWSSISLNLGKFDNIENLRLSGTGNIDATGNGSDNLITGNAGDNDISGGAGNDRLYGKGGADVFHFADFGAANSDWINDFDSDDAIALDGDVFTGLARANGHLAASDFVRGAAATIAGEATVIYNANTGMLSYDHDGKGGDAAQDIAFIGKKLDFDHTDILVL